MGIFSKIFKGNNKEQEKVGGMNDYMTLVRVYFQAALAARLGITNLTMLPDLRTYKQTFRVPTVNNKLGVGEKNSVRKTMKNLYGTSDLFFDEVDASIKKNCKKIQDAQGYLYQFQAYSQDLMMLIGNLMKFKLRVPGFFKKIIYTMTEKTVNDIYTKNDYSDPGVIKTVMSVRQLSQRLGFSRQWATEFVYQIVLLAKKEPKQNGDDTTTK
ncbi:hypothetical protein JCM15754A_16450 [Prevotella aurantiaca JCM 15754]|jgi:hypothetical protein|uniref:hypothetical protein n=1 Tax=Prevotella aurantiaca TaxID=596085 RepID=UPI000469E113|nr:hypothetical protein [Prevotella aurantiaca]MBF1386932.1 hypothetical protein [Prevotella aurantiaca]